MPNSMHPDYDVPDDIGRCEDCQADHRPSESCMPQFHACGETARTLARPEGDPGREAIIEVIKAAAKMLREGRRSRR